MQTQLTGPIVVILMTCCGVSAADRTMCVIPHDAQAGTPRIDQDSRDPESPDQVIPLGRQFADDAFGDAATSGWQNYLRVWKAHLADPSDTTIRRFFGLPLAGGIDAIPRRGRSAPRWLGWRLGSYAQIDTPHFTIFSRADASASREVALDLERCYWAWTQMFFPLWEGSPQVSMLLDGASERDDVSAFLKDDNARISVRRKLRVVLFRNASEYRQTLGKSMPGIERSTGFYSDEKQTTFLYASDIPDRATRRHEMVHQLFREATRSALGRRMPAEDSDFWLIEGIAGYFESLHLTEETASVGGWDASRLQYARHRVFVGGDRMPFHELTTDGRLAAQKRQDIARWYAHAIARTHFLMDGGDTASRQWVYRKLADLYEIKCDLPEVASPVDVDRRFESFLSIDDKHLQQNRVSRELTQLCLAGCEVTSLGIETIPATNRMRWLDLSRLPLSITDIRRLVPTPQTITQLSLEDTDIDNSIVTWLADATRIRELDLSWTDIDDAVTPVVTRQDDLETLWITGTKVSDASIDAIAKQGSLRSLDVQRTEVSEQGLAKLRQLRPKLEINPLELRTP